MSELDKELSKLEALSEEVKKTKSRIFKEIRLSGTENLVKKLEIISELDLKPKPYIVRLFEPWKLEFTESIKDNFLNKFINVGEQQLWHCERYEVVELSSMLECVLDRACEEVDRDFENIESALDVNILLFTYHDYEYYKTVREVLELIYHWCVSNEANSYTYDW